MATSQARIPDPAAGLTFLQIWEAESAAAQDGWLREMRANIDLLRVKPGFISMALHSSLDHKNLCVYAQWADQIHLEAAVDDPIVMGAREKLDRWAQPDGRTYSVHSIKLPRASGEASFEIGTGEALSSVSIWHCDDAEEHRRLLAALDNETAMMAAADGFLGMALHVSLDGKYVGVYARWRDLSAYQAAMHDNPAAGRSHQQLLNCAKPKTNVFRVEGVYLALSAPANRSVLSGRPILPVREE
jgi:quinol monooxygenase YgiN